MSQPNLINKPEVSNIAEENCLTEILGEIQATPKEYWQNLLQIMRVFRESVTFKTELLNHDQQEIDAQQQQILNQQSQALKQLTKEWIEEGELEDQTETWEYLRQEIDENPF
ncbi:hypothetical protein [Dolichospermum sp. UHCC 0259]|uniref:hypothetical protein n=1 Tax=Dolichospermum sp. UHCC 0259 TaxID=2590010 RepID=UPI00144529CD|nr:hypothetical protein [Dolichospermum sp. UHCC 0259]MTJ47921.1 hypothetical protein [Dolichospermum sp. UHCC 0259]